MQVLDSTHPLYSLTDKYWFKARYAPFAPLESYFVRDCQTYGAYTLKTVGWDASGHSFFDRDVGVALIANEAEILSRVSHPGICRLEEAHLDAAQPYLLLEYLAGTRLDEWLVSHPDLTATQRLLVCIGIAEAVSYLHNLASEIVHRDLRPQTVWILSGDQRPVLVDFGLAALPDSQISRPRGLSGTSYLPDKPVPSDVDDRATDIFALARIILTVLSGSPPSGKTTGSLPGEFAALKVPLDRAVSFELSTVDSLLAAVEEVYLTQLH